MLSSPESFNQSIAKWRAEQDMPWSRLKYALTQANLRRHLQGQPLHVLDAGGGDGRDALPFTLDGCEVTIVDSSREMLADARRAAQAADVDGRVTTHEADVLGVTELVPAASMDLVLCHNVLQYVDDVEALLHALLATLKPGGVLSLISLNRYAMPYRAAFMRDDLPGARTSLDQRDEVTVLFGTTAHEWTAEEIGTMLAGSGAAVEADYGIRCVCDYWGDNERKSNAETFAQIEDLEFALTDRYPYKLLARYFQVVARKP